MAIRKEFVFCKETRFHHFIRKTSRKCQRINSQRSICCFLFEVCGVVIFSFPYNPHRLIPTNPAPVPPQKLDFGPFWLRFGPFQVRLAPFRVCFGSVSDPFRVRFGVLGGVGVGSGRGASVREKNITNVVAKFRW